MELTNEQEWALNKIEAALSADKLVMSAGRIDNEPELGIELVTGEMVFIKVETE